MKLAEYAAHDALGLAELVARKQVTPKELAQTAARAIDMMQPADRRRRRDLSRSHRRPRRKHAGRGTVPRRSVPDQRRVRPREGPQDRVRLAAVRGHDGRGRHLLRRHAQGSRRQHPRPLRRARILDGRLDRDRPLRQHLDALEEGLLRRRLVGRRPGRRHIGHGADRARLRHRRLDPHSRQLLRRPRPQALARPRLRRPGRRRRRLRLLVEPHPGQDRARHGDHARLRLAAAAGRSLHHPEAGRELRLATSPRRRRS